MPLIYNADQLEQVIKETAGKAVSRFFHITETKGGIMPEGSAICFSGKDMKKHLSGCFGLVLVAVTLGHEVDQLLNRIGYQDISLAYRLHQAADAAIQHRMAEACLAAGRQFPYYTDYFSPGYGDFPLTAQKEILRLLDGEKRAGIFVTESAALLPLKSMTGIVGVSRHPVSGCEKGCAHCSMQERCLNPKGRAYRKSLRSYSTTNP